MTVTPYLHPGTVIQCLVYARWPPALIATSKDPWTSKTAVCLNARPVSLAPPSTCGRHFLAPTKPTFSLQ